MAALFLIGSVEAREIHPLDEHRPTAPPALAPIRKGTRDARCRVLDAGTRDAGCRVPAVLLPHGNGFSVLRIS